MARLQAVSTGKVQSTVSVGIVGAVKGTTEKRRKISTEKRQSDSGKAACGICPKFRKSGGRTKQGKGESAKWTLNRTFIFAPTISA